MSTYEVMGLRKYSRPEAQNGSNKSQTRPRGYLKDMLVSKFLTKHKIEIMGPINNQTRDLELKIQALVIREFDKFMNTDSFNQKILG